MPARSRQQDDPAARVGREGGERVVQLLHERGVERVQAVGAVEPELRDPRPGRRDENGGAHQAPPSPAAGTCTAGTGAAGTGAAGTCAAGTSVSVSNGS